MQRRSGGRGKPKLGHEARAARTGRRSAMRKQLSFELSNSMEGRRTSIPVTSRGSGTSYGPASSTSGGRRR